MLITDIFLNQILFWKIWKSINLAAGNGKDAERIVL